MFNNIFQFLFRIKNLISEFKLSPRAKDSNIGIVYTLYSDQLNLIKLGFARNSEILETKINYENFILLDKKCGTVFDLFLIKETLKLLHIDLINNNYFYYSNRTLRHLETLGWPIGNSLYKKRIIRKKFSCALT